MQLEPARRPSGEGEGPGARPLEGAERIHQTGLLGTGRGVDPALASSPHRLRLEASVFGHQLHEAGVDLLDVSFQRVPLAGGERSCGGEEPGMLAAGEYLAVDTDPTEELREVELAAEDSDAPEDAPGTRPDLLRPERD